MTTSSTTSNTSTNSKQQSQEQFQQQSQQDALQQAIQQAQQQQQQQAQQQGAQQSLQQSSSNPWAPTQQTLDSIIAGIQGGVPLAQSNPYTQQAFNLVSQNAQNTPNLGPAANAYTNTLLSGGQDRTGIVSGSLDALNHNMAPYLDPSYLDPTQTPGIQNLLGTIRNDVTSSVNGMFAGAGRDLSGANQQTLARGIAQGEAVPLLNQYNQNVGAQQGAANSVWNGGLSGAAALSGLDQQSLANQLQGYNFGLNVAPNVANNQATQLLGAGQLPLNTLAQNYGLLENLTVPIAGLGTQSQGLLSGLTSGTSSGSSSGTSSGTSAGMSSGTSSSMGSDQSSGTSSGNSSTTGTSTMSPFMAAMLGLGALFPKGLPSDRRLKNNVEQVGELFDGTPVYRFNYRTGGPTQIGLMAQDVEQYAPDAVADVYGYKHVDYKAATERALAVGAR